MLVNNTFGWIFIIIVGILATVSVGLLMIRLKIDQKYYTFAFAPGLLAGFILYTLTTCVIDVSKDGEILIYMGLGSTIYTATDGQKIHVIRKKNGTDTFIVNASDKMMALEYIQYGEPVIFINLEPELIPPHSTYEYHSSPDYFPDETPPNTTSVTKGVKSSSKYWLRYGK